jgi:GNAT superfamily N-acetyltransferase
MHQYPPEWNNYKTASEYQMLVTNILRQLFDPRLVIPEWDAAAHDFHVSPHKQMYFPRIDIAIGPFNSAMEIDVGFDNTGTMKSHPLYKKLKEESEIGWNNFSRCFLAIEVLFSGSSKYTLGDVSNASFTGSIGFVVAKRGEPHRKASRMIHYFQSRSDAEEAPLNNILVFQDDDFLQFLWELQHPDQVKKIVAEKDYEISFRKLWRMITFPLSIFTSRLKVEDDLSERNENKFSMYGLDIKKMIAAQEILLSARRYVIPTTSAFVYELLTKNGGIIKIMEILDMAAQPKFRGKGIESQLLGIFETIAKANNCRYIAVDMWKDRPDEPLWLYKDIFADHGFNIYQDARSQFSGYAARKELIK